MRVKLEPLILISTSGSSLVLDSTLPITCASIPKDLEISINFSAIVGSQYISMRCPILKTLYISASGIWVLSWINLNIGEEIKSIFHKVGLKNIKNEFSQPILKTCEHKRILELATKACAFAYIEHGLMTKDQINDLIELLDVISF